MFSSITATDFYKTGHGKMLDKGTSVIYSNFTPRSAHLAPVLKESFDNKVVWFGLQAEIKDFLIKEFAESFFKMDCESAVKKYKRRIVNALGGDFDASHIRELHSLGYLPLSIKSLPEGSRVNIKVPCFTITNTNPGFAWLVNYVETVLSCDLWKPTTTATVAFEYKKILTKWAKLTGTSEEFVGIQGHDFSFRGMSGREDARRSGMGHLTSFVGTDTVTAIDAAEEWYNADSDKELIGCSVPATEHMVMCLGQKDSELETFRRLIEDLYPTGIISIVSDTWDFWKVLTEHAPALKSKIMARKPNEIGLNKVVFRPDSGDPETIICGDLNAPAGSPANLGAVRVLWDEFGGTETETGHKLLDEHVGLIYGDSITLERANNILKRLESMGFASGNIVFGIGSFTYQYITRDTFGFAMKATYGKVGEEERELFKDPITDSGIKKSAKGLLRVERECDDFVLHDQQTPEQEAKGELVEVFRDGILLVEQSFSEIRERLSD